MDCGDDGDGVVRWVFVAGLDGVARIEHDFDAVIAAEAGGVPGPLIDALSLSVPVAPVERAAGHLHAVDQNGRRHLVDVEVIRHVGQQLESHLVAGVDFGHGVEDQVGVVDGQIGRLGWVGHGRRRWLGRRYGEIGRRQRRRKGVGRRDRGDRRIDGNRGFRCRRLASDDDGCGTGRPITGDKSGCEKSQDDESELLHRS